MTTRADLNLGRVEVPNRTLTDRELQDIQIVKGMNQLIPRLNHIQGFIHRKFCTKKKCICFEPTFSKDYILTYHMDNGKSTSEVKESNNHEHDQDTKNHMLDAYRYAMKHSSPTTHKNEESGMWSVCVLMFVIGVLVGRFLI